MIRLKVKVVKGSVFSDQSLSKINPDRVVVIDTCITPPLHPVLWTLARQRLGVTEHLPQEVMSQALVILISREIQRNVGRRLLNFKEVSDFLTERYGSERYRKWKGVTHLDSGLELFSKTAILIGIHGAGLYNSFFCPVETHILEIIPVNKNHDIANRGLASNIFWMMTSLVGQPYWRIYIHVADAFNNVILPMDMLAAVMERIDKEISNSSQASSHVPP